MHKIIIQVPVYQFKCIVIIDKDIEKRVNAFIKRHKWNEDLFTDSTQVHGVAVNPGVMDAYYIFYSIESVTANIITHEVSHLVDDVLEDRQINDTEARAYLSGYINEKIFDYVIKNKLLINKWILKTEKIQTEKDLPDQ
jgi:hypothetical protein